jgi:hypothetical protein
MTNLSSTSNSQVFTNDRKSIASRIRSNIPRGGGKEEKEFVLKEHIDGDIRPQSTKTKGNEIEEEKVSL